jgi:sterol 3beta-glucosyltransferase
MRIGIQTWGSDGDIQPFAALAGELSAVGHKVTLVVTSVYNRDYTALSEALKFKLWHVGCFDSRTEVVERIWCGVARERSPLKQLHLILSTLFDPVCEEIYEASKDLCGSNDIVIGHYLVYPLGIAAERAGRPYVTVSLITNLIPSRHAPPPGLPNLGEFLNFVWWELAGSFMNRLLKPAVNRMRIRERLPPVKSILGELAASRMLNLIATSRCLCPEHPDWEDHHYVCGFFNIPEQAEQWEMPSGLKQFLVSGPPPVDMTFGSMLSFDPSVQETTRLMVDAARLAGCRAIVQSRWEEIRDIPEYRDIYRITRVPHRYIFPHCVAVVHHGAAGTAQASSIYGCPSVVVEHTGDQVLWGIALNRAGIAPRPLHRRTVNAEHLAAVIRGVLDSPQMVEKAKEIGKTMRREDGLKRAVELIEKRMQV